MASSSGIHQPDSSQEFVSDSYDLTLTGQSSHVRQPNKFRTAFNHFSAKHPKLSGRLQTLVLYVRGPQQYVDLPRE